MARSRSTPIVFAALIAIASVLGGCGRRGSLELPTAEPTAMNPETEKAAEVHKKPGKPKASFTLDPLL